MKRSHRGISFTGGFFNHKSNMKKGKAIVGKLSDPELAYAHYDYPPWENKPDYSLEEILAIKVDPLR